MEVFLLVTLPRKRRPDRLKIVIKRLSQKILSKDLLPGALGGGFWPIGLYLLRPLPHHGKVNRRHLAAFVEQDENCWMWGGAASLWRQEFLDSIGFRWEVTHGGSDQPHPAGVSVISDEKQQPPTWRFQFGRGPLFEGIPDDRLDLRAHLDQLLAAHPHLHGHSSSLQYHESSHTLVLTASDAHRRECWAIDLRTWTLVPSHEPEDWCTHRLSTALKSPQSPINEYVVFVKDLCRGINLQLSLFWNLLPKLGSEGLDSRWLTLVEQAAHELLRWLLVLQKFVVSPIDEVLRQPKYRDAVNPRSFESILASPGGPDDFPSGSFGQLVSQFSKSAHSLIQEQTLDALLDLQQVRDKLHTGWAEGFDGWAECISIIPTVSKSLLRRLKKLDSTKMSPETGNPRLSFTLEHIQSLYTGLHQFTQGPLRANLTGYGYQMSIPTKDGQMWSLPGLDEVEMLWGVMNNSGTLHMHTKSRSEPFNHSLLSISKTGQINSDKLPAELVKALDECRVLKPHRLFTESCVWILQGHFSASRLNIARVDLAESTDPQISRFLLKTINNEQLTRLTDSSVIAYVDKLIVIYPTKFKNPVQGINDIRLIQSEGNHKTLKHATQLKDVSCTKMSERFQRMCPHSGYISPNITRASCTYQFLSLRCLVAGSGLPETASEPVIVLSLLEIDFTRNEYKLLGFNSWKLAGEQGKFPRQATGSFSTFKVNTAEYFMCCADGGRFLVHFTRTTMSLVLVGGGHIHRLPAELGSPVRILGLSDKQPSLLYHRRHNNLLSSPPQFWIFLLKYKIH